MSEDDDVYVLEGEVVDTSRLSHTEVWSSGGGGGGYVGPHGGHVHVSAPQVHSQAVTNTDIYLRAANGKEHHLRIDRQDLPLRPGHLLAIAYVKDGSTWRMAILLNQSLNQYWSYPCARMSEGAGCLSLLLTITGVGLLVGSFGAMGYGLFKLQWMIGSMGLAGWVVASFIDAWQKALENGPQQRALAKAKRALGIAG